MAKFSQGFYTVKNPEKYVGTHAPRWRSSWEMHFMVFLDNHPSVLNWASESIRIPYRNPLTGKNTTYVPDFFIVYQDKNGTNHGEVIEIKPSGQVTLETAKGARNQAAAAVNMMKFQAARGWCASQGLVFRILTQQDLFTGSR